MTDIGGAEVRPPISAGEHPSNPPVKPPNELGSILGKLEKFSGEKIEWKKGKVEQNPTTREKTLDTDSNNPDVKYYPVKNENGKENINFDFGVQRIADKTTKEPTSVFCFTVTRRESSPVGKNNSRTTSRPISIDASTLRKDETGDWIKPENIKGELVTTQDWKVIKMYLNQMGGMPGFVDNLNENVRKTVPLPEKATEETSREVLEEISQKPPAKTHEEKVQEQLRRRGVSVVVTQEPKVETPEKPVHPERHKHKKPQETKSEPTPPITPPEEISYEEKEAEPIKSTEKTVEEKIVTPGQETGAETATANIPVETAAPPEAISQPTPEPVTPKPSPPEEIDPSYLDTGTRHEHPFLEDLIDDPSSPRLKDLKDNLEKKQKGELYAHQEVVDNMDIVEKLLKDEKLQTLFPKKDNESDVSYRTRTLQNLMGRLRFHGDYQVKEDPLYSYLQQNLKDTQGNPYKWDEVLMGAEGLNALDIQARNEVKTKEYDQYMYNLNQ
ncbi:MAG: hypothetical protein KKA64_03950, partial [Nanoarchaeota archaeon]|nr:hypothetical protein [Nanoarchaeota archaeon]